MKYGAIETTAMIIIIILLSLEGTSGGLTWVRHHSRDSSATHSCQRVRYLPVSKQWYGYQCFGFSTCAQTLMPAVARGSCMDTVRESALQGDSGRKIPCRTGDSNPCQYCPRLFSRTLDVNNNNVHLSCAHQRPERSHDIY